jgi:hypothetical protein
VEAVRALWPGARRAWPTGGASAAYGEEMHLRGVPCTEGVVTLVYDKRKDGVWPNVFTYNMLFRALR